MKNKVNNLILNCCGRNQSLSMILFMIICLFAFELNEAVAQESYVSFIKKPGSFAIASGGDVATLYINSGDYTGVRRASYDLQKDILRITNAKPPLSIDNISPSKQVIIIGTIGISPIIQILIDNKKIDVSAITGKRESYLIQVVNKPRPGIESALVIAGSDKRGTIFGIYDLSSKIGVSPWYYWADVPAESHSELFVLPGAYISKEPVVKYRGIFINDEAPALSGWVHEKFGGFNHKFYENVFELILRMKGNYLWPAMWGNAFNADDSLNAKIADDYGIVLGTSHHEPMVRAHDEWRRFGSGPWNYEKNEAKLKEFWHDGIKRMKTYENIVTVGMRGDGDEPMSEESNIALLEKIVSDQRTIIQEVTGKNPAEIPQMWALYKEVQDYYDKGMRVPDDVTLLLCDDNWGNIRKLPKLGDPPRKGGYGIYYHFDYVGGPRNYKWLNTNQISRVWEQMHLAYEYGANEIWIVNVGDIKPMEFPISFFLDYAWNPAKITAESLPEYTRNWAEKQFGAKYAEEIAAIITKYTMYNSRRKPELLSPETYSLVNYLEAERIVTDYNTIATDAGQIYQLLPPNYQDAFYQLVLFPVQACANLNEMYVSAGKNKLYASQGRASTNTLSAKVKQNFERDIELTDYYNKTLANGKWNHMMDQTHIGYTYWQQPDKNTMPDVVKIDIPAKSEMAIAIEGTESWWPNDTMKAVLPEINPFQQQPVYFEIYNRGSVPFDFTIEVQESDWLLVSSKTGKVENEQRLWVSVDWQQAPVGKSMVPITILASTGEKIIIKADVNNPESPRREEVNGFVENHGVVSIEAEHFSRKIETGKCAWQIIPELGRTLSGIMPIPVDMPKQVPGRDSLWLEYDMYLFGNGDVKVQVYFSPTLNFQDVKGLHYGVSFDDEMPQIIGIHSDNSLQAWEKSVSNNITKAVSAHRISSPGKHTLKIWAVDPGIVIQKIVVDRGGEKPSYLGPPESFFTFGD